jgi:hypothetical protein
MGSVIEAVQQFYLPLASSARPSLRLGRLGPNLNTSLATAFCKTANAPWEGPIHGAEVLSRARGMNLDDGPIPTP